MASLCVFVMRGSSTPLVVLLISRAALASTDDAPDEPIIVWLPNEFIAVPVALFF